MPERRWLTYLGATMVPDDTPDFRGKEGTINLSQRFLIKELSASSWVDFFKPKELS